MTTMTSVELSPEDLFGGNPESRLAAAFLLDCSSSMEGIPIEEVNAGMKYYVDFIKDNAIARNRLDTSIVSFGGQVTTHCANAVADDLEAPALRASGGTPMGAALLMGIEVVEKQKQYYKDNGIDYIKPIIICLTDGEPTDTQTFATAVEELRLAEVQDMVSFYCFGCNKADLSVMERMGLKHPPVLLKDVNIKTFFQKVSVVVSSFIDDDGQSPLDELMHDTLR